MAEGCQHLRVEPAHRAPAQGHLSRAARAQATPFVEVEVGDTSEEAVQATAEVAEHAGAAGMSTHRYNSCLRLTEFRILP